MQYSILLYEDQTAEKDNILRALTTLVHNSLWFRVVWFQQGFPPPPSKNVRENVSWPMILRSQEDAPTVFKISQQGVITEESSTLTWWQADFHGAILDVFHQGRNLPFGEDYADWLQYARFQGPVIFASAVSVSTAVFPWLPNLHRVSKGEHGEAWIEAVTDYLIQGLLLRDPNIPLVTARGRDPRSVLVDFYGFHRNQVSPNRTNIDSWSSFWIGNDLEFRDKLVRFFDAPSIPEDNLPSKFRSPVKTDSDWANVIKHIDTNANKIPRPKILWIDCNDVIKPQVSSLVCDVLDSISFRPLVFLLGDRVEKMSRGYEAAMFRYGVSILPRLAIEHDPIRWAEDTVELLAYQYHQWKALWERKINSEDPDRFDLQESLQEERLIKSYLPVFVMARSAAVVAGEKGHAHLVPWLAQQPLLSTILNSNFPKELRKILKKKMKADLIDTHLGSSLNMKNVESN